MRRLETDHLLFLRSDGALHLFDSVEGVLSDLALNILLRTEIFRFVLQEGLFAFLKVNLSCNRLKPSIY